MRFRFTCFGRILTAFQQSQARKLCGYVGYVPLVE